jgi:peptidoglycan/xylan/chitin deacetylase (PgdA/CDA1 family)
VTPQRFAEHLEVVRKHGCPVPLKKLDRALQDGKRPPRSIAITFDDGYANNLHKAKPLLECYDIPATVFVTSGYIERNREFWWDELEQVLVQPGKLPEEISLQINGSVSQWTLGASVDYSEADYRSDCNRYAPNAEPGTRLFFYYSIWQQLQPAADKQRRDAMDKIFAWANVKPAARPTHRPLTPGEICMLEEGGLLEIGAHTVTHPFLAVHPRSSQRDEIRQSKADLEEVLGHPVTSFSYPHGNYTAETVALVREAGFNCACSTVPGVAGSALTFSSCPVLKYRIGMERNLQDDCRSGSIAEPSKIFYLAMDSSTIINLPPTSLTICSRNRPKLLYECVQSALQGDALQLNSSSLIRAILHIKHWQP